MKNFCREKWEWLGIRLLDWEIRSCPSSNYKSLPVINPTSKDFFNFQDIVNDRKSFLNDMRSDRCNFCWVNEDRNLTSRRLRNGRDIYDDSFVNVDNVKPKKLDIILNSECLNQCVYCCPNYSTSWTKDVLANDDYGHEHYQVNERVKLHYLANQKQKLKSSRTQQLIKMLEDDFFDKLEEVWLSGGEPFLDGNFQRLVNSFIKKKNLKTIFISSGLNFNVAVLEKFQNNLLDTSKLRFQISFEAVGTTHEFIRWGSKWDQWITNFNYLDEHYGNQITIKPTLNCLAMPGIVQFMKLYKNRNWGHCIVSEPTFLSPHIIPKVIKEQILRDIVHVNSNNYEFNIFKNLIIDICNTEDPEISLKQDLHTFLNKFAANKNIELSTYLNPIFLSWLSSNSLT
jgi:organic radical activating enzyme